MNLARLWHLVLPGVLIWVFFAMCFRRHLLYPLDEALLLLVHSQSSGLLFMEKTLTFSSKSGCHAQVLFPLAAWVSLSLMLGNSNKIFPQYFVLNCSQPDFFIHFISLCVHKDCISITSFYNPFSSNIFPLLLLH